MSVQDINSYVFDSPCTISLAGGTKSGKSTWIFQLIKNRDDLFKQKTTKVIYCYGIWDKNFESVSDVEFIKGIPSDIENINPEFSFDQSSHVLLILDDLVHDIVNNFDVQNLFTRGSHHSNVSVVFTSQNMYYQGRCGKTIRNNVMYWVVFNKSCDLLQLSTLGSRYGIKPALMYAIDDNQYTMYAYILIDLCPTNVSKIKVLTGIFPHELRIGYF